MKSYLLFITIPFAVATAPIWLAALAIWLLLPYLLRALLFVLPHLAAFTVWLAAALAESIGCCFDLFVAGLRFALPIVVDVALVLAIVIAYVLYFAALALNAAHLAIVATLPAPRNACSMIANAFSL